MKAITKKEIAKEVIVAKTGTNRSYYYEVNLNGFYYRFIKPSSSHIMLVSYQSEEQKAASHIENKKEFAEAICEFINAL